MSEHDYKSIFSSALAIEDEARRSEYLEGACGGDADLRDRVESLLAAHAEAQAFMQSPTLDQKESVPGPCLGDMVGPYKLREKLGEGGMGIVYIAEQTEPVRRKVALKIIKPGMDTREVIARFQAERQALAMMDHPNVARVFDGGSTEGGYPYFVMELVRGVPITKYCDEASLSTQARLELFLTVCGAIQHAHQRGIIHRDIKPSNVLVSLHDGAPVVKVIDFGVAKALNQQLTQLSVYTRFQQIIGTPLYMSPEQAELSGLDIDTRTDVYSLGVLLYELLTGVTPFDKKRFLTAAYDEMRRIIREDEPPKPSTRVSSLTHAEQTEVAKRRGSSPMKLSQSLKGELDWIVTKALEKDRGRRYESASDLADDVNRYLHQEPVKAVAPSRWYKLRKLMARNKLVAAASLIVVSTLVLGIAGTSWQAVRARRTEIAALQQAYVAELPMAQQAYYEFDTARAMNSLVRQVPASGQPDFRKFEWRELWTACNQQIASLRGHTEDVRKMSFSHDGMLLASASEDLTMRVWDLRSMRELVSFEALAPALPYDLVLHACDFSPDGRYLVTQFGAAFGSPDLVLWDVEALRDGRKEEVLRIPDVTDNVYCLKFTPDSKGIAVGSVDGRLRIVDIETSAITEFTDESLDAKRQAYAPESVTSEYDQSPGVEVLDSERVYAAPAFPQAHAAKVTCIDFSADGRTMVSSGFDPAAIRGAPAVKVWNVDTGSLLQSPADGKPHVLHGVAITSDGSTMACGGQSSLVNVWSVHNGEPIEPIDVNAYGVLGLAFSESDKYLGVATLDERLQIFRTADWKPVATLRHPYGCLSIAFSPIGDLLVTGGDDPTIRVWDMRKLSADLLLHEAPVRSVRYSKNGRYLAVGMASGGVIVWNTITNDPALTIESPQEVKMDEATATPYIAEFSAFDHDSRYLAAVGPANTVKIWDVERKKEVALLEHGSGVIVYAVAFSPDGQTLLTGTNKQEIVAWDWRDEDRTITKAIGKPAGDFIRDLKYSPDERMIACAALNVYLLDAASLELRKTFRPATQINNAVLSVAFSPDGEWLAAAEAERVVSLWSLTDKQSYQLPHQTPVTSVSFSPDGKRLASSDFAATTILWDMALKQRVAKYSGYASDFHPGGDVLACGNLSGLMSESSDVKMVRLLRARTFEEIDRELAGP